MYSLQMNKAEASFRVYACILAADAVDSMYDNGSVSPSSTVSYFQLIRLLMKSLRISNEENAEMYLSLTNSVGILADLERAKNRYIDAIFS